MVSSRFLWSGRRERRLEAPRKGTVADEAHVPAEQPAAQANPRVLGAHGDPGGAKRAEATPAQGSQTSHRAGSAQACPALASEPFAQTRRDVSRFDAEQDRTARLRQGPSIATPRGVPADPEAGAQESQCKLRGLVPSAVTSARIPLRVQREPSGGQLGGAQSRQAPVAGI